MSIQLHSFVWVQNERMGKRVGYIEDTYEDLQGKKMVTIRYFLFTKDIERHARRRLFLKPREIFATSSLHQVNAESIGGAAEVLSLEDFERCSRRHPDLPRNLASNAFVCYREYKDGAVCRPFRLSDLEGYSTQGILSSLHHYEAIAMEAEDCCSESESTTTVDES